jgi:hypothetical protein
VLSRMRTTFGSPEEDAVRERVRAYLDEMGPTVEETLSVESGDDIVVLHNDDAVCCSGRVLMGDALQGSPRPSQLLSDYFAAGLRLVDPAERAEVSARILALGKAD